MSNPFTQVLVDVLGSVANAGVKAYTQGQAPAAGVAGGGKKKRGGCSSCKALADIERARARNAKGKL